MWQLDTVSALYDHVKTHLEKIHPYKGCVEVLLEGLLAHF